MGGLEVRVGLQVGHQLAADAGEDAVVRAFGVCGRSFSLDHDLFEGPESGSEVGHLEEPGQAEVGACDLGVAVTDEDRVLAVAGHEVLQGAADAVVEVALGPVVLGHRRQQVRTSHPLIVSGVGEPGPIDQVDALRPLDEGEVVHRGPAELPQ